MQKRRITPEDANFRSHFAAAVVERLQSCAKSTSSGGKWITLTAELRMNACEILEN
jgi:hypothetical protein